MHERRFSGRVSPAQLIQVVVTCHVAPSSARMITSLRAVLEYGPTTQSTGLFGPQMNTEYLKIKK